MKKIYWIKCNKYKKFKKPKISYILSIIFNNRGSKDEETSKVEI